MTDLVRKSRPQAPDQPSLFLRLYQVELKYELYRQGLICHALLEWLDVWSPEAFRELCSEGVKLHRTMPEDEFVSNHMAFAKKHDFE